MTKPPFRKKKTIPLTRGERVIGFIEKYCCVPEGKLVGQPMRLDQFQKDFILAVYDNKVPTTKGILSIARKNGKTGLIAGIVLAHIAGPEARLNSQIVSGAMSRDQAALVFKLASKMVMLSPELSARVRIVPSSKILVGLSKNVEYQALSAEAKTKHGLSPVLAILDEVGQVRGPSDDFVDAIITAQGAHDDPLLLVISTQAPNDADLLSLWIDDALNSKDKSIVCHVYTADKEADLGSRKEWKAANPAMGTFRSVADMENMHKMASRLPSFEPTFRNLNLNQRVEMTAPFVSRNTWKNNGGEVDMDVFYNYPVYGSLDLSARNDLTAAVFIAITETKVHVACKFWTPADTLEERAKRDRAPYPVWVASGHLTAIPGNTIDYEVVARDIEDFTQGMDLQKLAYDRWRIDIFKKELARLGIELPLVPFGQGFKDMSPAIEVLEAALVNSNMLHGSNPVLTMCMANVRVESDPAGNRKFNKAKSTGRIDGGVALVMAHGVAASELDEDGDIGGFLRNPVIV